MCYGGVRYINLNSECARVGGCDVGSPQYQFVQQTLAANDLACVVTYWHRPVVSSVTNNYPMRPIWKLLATNGGDLVLNGHTHDMEIYGPLDGDLNANQADSTMWEIISGSGGHAMTSAVATDPRNVWQKTKTPGALYMTNVGGAGGNATAINFAFRNVAGNVISSGGVPGTGTIDCGDGAGGPGVFSDDFATGLGKWDQVAGVTIDSTQGDHSGPPSARAEATANKRYLRTNLGGTYGSACATASVRVASGTGSISLIRFKTAANVGIGRVYVNMATNELWLRSDVSGTIKRSNTTMSRSQWHDLELCATAGVSGTYDLSLDGAPILSWNANNGTNPIGMVQLGDSSNQTYTANFDDVEVVEP